MPTITMPNDFGHAGEYYDEKPRGNEILWKEPLIKTRKAPLNCNKYFKKLTAKDKRILKDSISVYRYKQVSDDLNISISTISLAINSIRPVKLETFRMITDYLRITEKMECLKWYPLTLKMEIKNND